MTQARVWRALVDTSVWSLAVRRRPGQLSAKERAIVFHWRDLVRNNAAVLIGPVRQELLTGISEIAKFERLREQLQGFDDETLSYEDFEEAARFSNICLSAGIAGSQTDLLICSVAVGRGIPIFSTDPDFMMYARHVPIQLYRP